jgi:hypothetical protein
MMERRDEERFGLVRDPALTQDLAGDWARAVYVLPPTARQLAPDLWVVQATDPTWAAWLHFAFLEAFSHDATQTWCTVLLYGEGPLEGLGECRHTYWGEDGYLHMPNAAHIRAALAWLEAQGYDLE